MINKFKKKFLKIKNFNLYYTILAYSILKNQNIKIKFIYFNFH